IEQRGVCGWSQFIKNDRVNRKQSNEKKGGFEKSRATNFAKPGDSICDPGHDQRHEGERGQNVRGKSDSPDLPITVFSPVIDGDKGRIRKRRKERRQKRSEENKNSDVPQTIKSHRTIDQ